MSSEINSFKPIAEAISMLFFPHAEVVIHDFKTKCVQAICNNLSKRKIGDESLLDIKEELIDSCNVFPPYFKTNRDGRKMKSVSAVLRNQFGHPIGLLCINLDISKWEQMYDLVRGFIDSKIEQPHCLFKNDWREKINVYVSSYLKNYGLCLKSLHRTEKQKLLFELKEKGAFATKNAAFYVADVLQISRATVYKYLKEKSL